MGQSLAVARDGNEAAELPGVRVSWDRVDYPDRDNRAMEARVAQALLELGLAPPWRVEERVRSKATVDGLVVLTRDRRDEAVTEIEVHGVAPRSTLGRIVRQ